jgi:hypothetical protein
MRQMLSNITKGIERLLKRQSSKGIWCVVANIADEHLSGPGGAEVKGGTKHFRRGALVYCSTALWGDGYEKIKVVGRHRGSNRYVTMIIRSAWLTNWRVKQVYSPHVTAELRRMGATWDGSRRSKRVAERIVGGMRKNSP